MSGRTDNIGDPIIKAAIEDLASRVAGLSANQQSITNSLKDVIEHTVQFGPHAAPAVDTATHAVAAGEYRAVTGFASITGTPNGAETVDVKVDGTSILNAVAGVGAAGSGVLVPLVFKVAAPYKFGKKIEYIFNDGGVASPCITTVQIRWATN